MLSQVWEAVYGENGPDLGVLAAGHVRCSFHWFEDDACCSAHCKQRFK